jgi:hypothetical protein
MLCFILHARLRVHLASGIPCALDLFGCTRNSWQSSGARRREIAEARRFFSPPTRARSAWRGGVGGGGCLSGLTKSLTRGDTPAPDPSPQRARARRGRRKRFNIYFGYEDDWQICAWRAPSRWQFGNSNALRALTLLAGRWVAATEVRTPGNAAFPIFSRWSIDGFAAGAAWFGMAR